MSERLAHTPTEAVLRHMDLIFTLHGGGAVTRLAWYLEFLAADTDAGRRSRARTPAARGCRALPTT